MNIREVSISRLREYENNPRNNDLAVEKVKYSIERFGFLFPVVVDMNYTIVCGHTRVRACRELGIQIVPCIIADELTEEQINLFRLIDNKTSEYSDWDFEKLKSELSTVDLTLEKNQLLLERFELTAEVFDIEPEQAEIKVAAFNFMGVNDNKSKKPSVSTIYTDDVITDKESEAGEQKEFSQTENILTVDNVEQSPAEVSNEIPEPIENVSKSEEVSEHKQSKAMRQFCQFRFGDIAFFISQIELDKLNEKYAEYRDSDESLKQSFASYLLEEVDSND